MTRLRTIMQEESGEVEDIPALTIVLVGILCPLIAVIVFMGRFGLADNTIHAAAAAAARDASLSASTVDAVPHAIAAAHAALNGNVTCRPLTVTIGGDGLRTTLGQTGTVTATITCQINTADLAFPLIPGSVTITETAASPVDPYRER
jgi:hypothetical protein